MKTIRRLSDLTCGPVRAALAGLMLAACAAMPAQAEFRGGGVLFNFAGTCEQHGWPVGRSQPVLIRYRDFELYPWEQSSQLSISFGIGVVNVTAWGRTMETSGQFLGIGMRTIFSRWNFHQNQPRARVLLRQITSLIDPDGPESLENARSVVLRVRIQNWSDLTGCAVTLVAAMRRI